MHLIQKSVMYGNKNIRNKTQRISHTWRKEKLVENFIVTTDANVAKPMNNPTQNQGMIHSKMINLIKELEIQIGLLRESLTNLTTKPHIEPDPQNCLVSLGCRICWLHLCRKVWQTRPPVCSWVATHNGLGQDPGDWAVFVLATDEWSSNLQHMTSLYWTRRVARQAWSNQLAGCVKP